MSIRKALAAIGYSVICILTFRSMVSPVLAAEKHWKVQGAQLKIISPCARSVNITRADGGSEFGVYARAERAEEIDKINISANDSVIVISHAEGGCSAARASADLQRPALGLVDVPSLSLDISLPPNVDISITEDGIGKYNVADLGGGLDFKLNGAGSVEAAAASNLSIEADGSGAINVSRADGTVNIKQRGVGAVSISALKAEEVNIYEVGLAGIKLGSGEIGQLNVIGSGAGRVNIESIVKNAKFQLSGVSKVYVEKIEGRIEKDITGAAKLFIGN